MIPCRHFARQRALVLTVAVVLATPLAASALDLIYIDIADTSTTIPGVGGNFTSFSSPEINSYTVAFQGNKAGYTGIFTSSGGPLTGVVDTTTNVPNTLTPFTSFSAFSLDSNQVAFNGSSSGNQGIYLTMPIGLSKVADLTTAIPNGTGNFTSLSAPSLSQGNLAFIGNGASSQQGVYSTYNGLHVVADTTTAIPNGTGNFVAGSFALATQTSADTNFVGGGTAGQTGIYDDYYYGSTSEIANNSTAVPGGTGNFSSFGSVIHGNYGDFVWVAGSLPGTGIYTNNGGPISVIANGTTSIPGGIGNFTSFGAASHSNSDVAFIGNGSGGQVGLYTNSGGSLVNVIAKGSILNGKTVTSVSTSASQAINNGTLVFNVTFSDGSSAVYAAEQNYNWAADTSGTWDNAANWSFGVKPGAALWTNINPDSGILLTGPSASTAILGLTIGANNGNGIAELRLQPGAQLTVSQYAYINSYGQITLNGSVFYANNGLNNSGVFSLSGGQVAGGGFYNQGTVEGSGTIGNYFENDDYPWAAGFVQSLNAIVHFANGFNNYSEYQVINSQVQLDGNIENYGSGSNGFGASYGLGRFDIRNSILQFTSGITNQGQLNFSFGTSDVFGSVTNQGPGQVIVSGNSNVTFYDAVTHNGTLFQVSPGSTAVFFGLVNGSSSFTGGGNIIFEGGYSPSLAPAGVSLDGPVTFDATNTLNIQLGGPVQGSGYDYVHVAGSLSLDGSLQVTLINGYLPNVGTTFDVLDWTSVAGSFASTPLSTQQGILKLFWNTAQTPSNINLTLTRAYYDIESGVYSQTLSGIGYELVKSTSATAIITGNNSYTGATTISAGTLQLNDGGALGSGPVTDNGNLAFNYSGTNTVGYVISGSGNVTQMGVGTTILTVANNYSGSTTISAGTLQVNTGGSIGSGSVSNAGILAFNQTGTTTVLGAISGGGSLTQMNSGTTILTGAVSYSGLTTISAGELEFGGNNTDSIANVTGSGVLQVDASTHLVSNGVKMPSGTLTINGNDQIRANGSTQGVTKVSALVLTTGTLDLTNNLLVVETTGGAAKTAELAALKADITGGAITSSTITSTTGLALVDNGIIGKTSMFGVPLDPNSILVVQAIKGDANLDGTVNLADLTLELQYYNTAHSTKTWNQGNFGGASALADLTSLLQDYNHTYGNFNLAIGIDGGNPVSDPGGSLSGGSLSSPAVTSPTGGAGSTSAVPEPASLMLLGLGAAALLTRRKRRR